VDEKTLPLGEKQSVDFFSISGICNLCTWLEGIEPVSQQKGAFYNRRNTINIGEQFKNLQQSFVFSEGIFDRLLLSQYSLIVKQLCNRTS